MRFCSALNSSAGLLAMTFLRQRFLDDLELRNCAPRMREAYVAHVAQFARHFGRSPLVLGREEIRQYLLYLRQVRRLSTITVNQCRRALRSLYQDTLRRPECVFDIEYRRQPTKLPVVLSREEVRDLLRATYRRRDRLALALMYATGLRISEAVRLAVPDIDSRRMVIRVAQGKGNEQRQIPLSQRLLEELRAWWCEHRNPVWLYPGQRPDLPIHANLVQKAFQRAAARIGLKKAIGYRPVDDSTDSGPQEFGHDGGLHPCATESPASRGGSSHTVAPGRTAAGDP